MLAHTLTYTGVACSLGINDSLERLELQTLFFRKPRVFVQCLQICICGVCNVHATGLMLVVGSTFFPCIYFISFHRWEHEVSNAVRRMERKIEFAVNSHVNYMRSAHLFMRARTRCSVQLQFRPFSKWCYVAGLILVFGILSRTHTQNFLRSNFFIWPSFICQTTSVIGRQIYISDWYRSYNKSDCWTSEVNLPGHHEHVGSIYDDGQTCAQYSCHPPHSIRAT